VATNAFGDIKFDRIALNALLNGQDGPVARDLSKRAIKIRNAAVQNATGSPRPPPRGGGPGVRTGRLRSSITWVVNRDGQGLYADIGTNVIYGLFLELGTVRMPAYPFLLPALRSEGLF
jgi:hypothetical protein